MFGKLQINWNGAIYTDEFAGINPNLSYFSFAGQFLGLSPIAKVVWHLYPMGKNAIMDLRRSGIGAAGSCIAIGRGFFVKAIFRFISFFCLAAAVGVGVFDSIRSVSTFSVDLMSARDVWFELFPSALAMAQAGVAHYIHPEAWRWFENGLAVVPAFAVLLALSLLFWMAGYRKLRALGRFSA